MRITSTICKVALARKVHNAHVYNVDVMCDNVHADAHICTTYGASSSGIRGSKAYTDVMFMYMYEYTL